ncbi:hypothetical protein MVEN_02592800 [Mycena venus]|uniref:Uncharacterized protein n=1 Tax=Mycena venus TaxID=2733690 RepID=A0A8H6WU32_9AGAR|nr:hypothetical protein MVEN_02592800 [Mycena venus]
MYIDIKHVSLTTRNITCRHHRPLSRFVLAEVTDLTFKFSSHYVPVTAVPADTKNIPSILHHLLLRQILLCL